MASKSSPSARFALILTFSIARALLYLNLRAHRSSNKDSFFPLFALYYFSLSVCVCRLPLADISIESSAYLFSRPQTRANNNNKMRATKREKETSRATTTTTTTSVSSAGATYLCQIICCFCHYHHANARAKLNALPPAQLVRKLCSACCLLREKEKKKKQEKKKK